MSHIDNAAQKLRTARIEAAKHYAAADKSDPFSFSRAMTHIDNGIASGDKGIYYEAVPYSEERSYEFNGETVTYHATAYKNMARA